MNERTNERKNEWMNEWTNERTNERTNEWMNVVPIQIINQADYKQLVKPAKHSVWSARRTWLVFITQQLNPFTFVQSTCRLAQIVDTGKFQSTLRHLTSLHCHIVTLSCRHVVMSSFKNAPLDLTTCKLSINPNESINHLPINQQFINQSINHLPINQSTIYQPTNQLTIYQSIKSSLRQTLVMQLRLRMLRRYAPIVQNEHATQAPCVRS